MTTRKYLRPLAVLVSLFPAVALLAAPTIDVQKTEGTPTKRGTLTAKVHYREARADKPPPSGDDGNVENIKRLCGLLGVSGQFHGSAPAKCGLKKVGREPEAVLCATPPPKNTSQTEDSKNRKCEYCVGIDPEVKCDEELRVEASVETEFSLPVYGVTVKCNAGAKYEAEAKARIEVQNTKWNSVEDGQGTDDSVTYVSSLTKSTASSSASINLGGGCTIDGKVVTAEMNAKLALKCEMKSTVTLGSTATRDKKTCGDIPDASPIAADADVVTEDDAGASDAAPADAAKPDAAVVDASKVPVQAPAM